MEFLRLMGVGADGSVLILVGTEGKQFRLVVDDGLRTAVRNARVLPPAPHHTTLALPPREIQARLRAGASAETVATDAGIPVEKVRRYETPILAERAHVAGLAQQALVRRPASGTAATGTRTLAQILTDFIAEHGYHSDALQWDAWRREDGRWTVQVGLPHAPNQPTSWTFEPPTRAVSPNNDMAREVLALPLAPAPATPAPSRSNVHELSLVRGRDRASEATVDRHIEEQLIAAAAEVTTNPVGAGSLPDEGENCQQVAGAHQARVEKTSSTKKTSNRSTRSTRGAKKTSASQRRACSSQASSSKATEQPQAGAPHVELPEKAAVGETSRPSTGSSRARARVPAWDDILFGGSN